MPLLLQALKLSWRSLWKQRLYAVVIVLSLALGLSFSNILIGFAVREQQTDSFHEKRERLFRLLSDDPFEQGEQLIFVLEQAAPHLLERYPEVAAVCRLFDLKRAGVDLRMGVSIVPEVMALGADSTFFDMFDFPVHEGRLGGALRPGQLVLSRPCAAQLFGDRAAVGETVSIRVDSVDRQFFRIVAAFALVSVLITCFGLFALAWGVTQSRSREIGIRKVLGAAPWQIAQLLLEDYFRWVLLAAILALPTAGYLMQHWLANFAFHAPIDGWAFGLTGLSVVLVTLFSVGFQTVRSAFLHPADELKNE